MKSKNILKKVGLIIVLIVIIIGIVFVVKNSSSGKKEEKNNNSSTEINKPSKSEKKSDNEEQEEQEQEVQEQEIQEQEILEENIEKRPTTVTELEDGVKYSVVDEEIKPEIVVGDNYFDTQITDFSLNFDQYEGKTVEIEGLYFENLPYTFVGRYSTSNICPTCPTGYSFFEYEWKGDNELSLTDSENWIKIIGTFKRGNDGEEYYYIDVASIELMNEKGIETVSN